MSSDNVALIMRQPLLFTVETAGQHRFAYTKFELDTGRAVWRWPDTPPSATAAASEGVEPVGQLLDVTV